MTKKDLEKELDCLIYDIRGLKTYIINKKGNLIEVKIPRVINREARDLINESVVKLKDIKKLLGN